MGDLSNIWLACYVLAWIITLIWYQKKKKYFDPGSFIICSYLLYAISSLFLYNNSYYGPEFKEIHLLPFVYLYLMLMLALKPIIKYDVSKIERIQRPSNFALYTIIFIYVLASLLRLVHELPHLMDGLTRILLDSAGGSDIYNEMRLDYDTKGDGAIVSLPAIISNVLGDMAILIFFYYMTLPDEKKVVTILLFVGILSTILSFVAESQRGPVLGKVMALLVTYFTIRKFIPLKRNRIIQLVLIVSVIVISIPIIAISISRFSTRDGGGTIGSFCDYAGQANLNFNNYAFDNNGIRYGDRTFPLFKRLLGFENVPHNFVERRNKYPHLYIDDGCFIGYVGDFCLDFGPIITVFIFAVFTLFVISATKVYNRTIKFHQLLLLHFVIYICTNGGMKLYPYADMGNLNVISLFMAYFFFLFDYNNQMNRKKSTSSRVLLNK